MRARPFTWPSPYDTPPPKGDKTPAPKPAPVPAPRRGLLGTMAALAVVPSVIAAAAASSPDAELLTICASIMREHQQMQLFGHLPLGATAEEEQAIEDAFECHCDRRDEWAEKAAVTASLTLHGVRAKTEAARVIAYKNDAGLPDPSDQPDYVSNLLWSILADVSRLTGGAA